MNSWCPENSLTPHSAKGKAMLLRRKQHIEPLNSVSVGEDRIGGSYRVGEWVRHTRLGRYYRQQTHVSSRMKRGILLT